MIKNKAMTVLATGSLLLGGVASSLVASSLLAPSTDTGVDCQARLMDPAPLSVAEREFLETCVSAFTLPTPTSSPSQPPTATPTPAPTTTAPTSTAPPTTHPPTPPASGFPTPATTGVPSGWVPTQVRTTDLRVTTSGAVIQDIRFVNADLIIDAPNVTVRRVELQSGRINNVPNSTCRNGLVVEDVSLILAPGPVVTRFNDPPAIQHGGYTARRVEINGLPEGFRVGGRGSFNCGPTTIQDSFARIVRPMPNCGDWHGDGVQGYDGPALTARNNTLELVESGGCGGTAPFFYPRNQGNTSVVVDRLLVIGGGYSFRLGMPGSVTGLRIAAEWGYGPIDVRCSVVSSWEAQVVTVDNYVPTFVRNQSCNTESGF